MSSARMITLFSEQIELSQRPFSFVASILAHGAVGGLVAFGILYSPPNNGRVLTSRYTVRHVELHQTQAQMRESAGSSPYYPDPYPRKSRKGAGHKPAEQQAALEQITQPAPVKQTLVQPDIKPLPAPAKEIPVPTVVIWTGKKTPVKTIVAPKPEAPTAADVRPVMDPPNEELNVADLAIASSDKPSPLQPVVPSNTSPVAVKDPDRLQMAPATTSESPAPPTPASVISQSDLHMAEGTVVLPPVNESAPAASAGALAQGSAGHAADAGSGKAASPASGAGAGKTSPGAADKPAPHAAGGKGGEAKTAAPAAQAGSGSGAGSQGSAAHITLPINGQFGAVVVGSSLEDEFPETAQLESGRLAYTVYLHVGLAKSWILQYWLPRTADAAEAGNIGNLEAPWPYNIVRPNIDPGAIDADALMIHGFVNQQGVFEGLAISFPPDFAQAQFVLASLAQWRFRAATQNGQNVKVEVLLIIPEELQ